VVKWGRILTAMVTPMDQQLQVDFEKAAKLARFLVDNGSDGLVVAGTTGESPTLTHHEKVELFKTVKKAVGETPVIAGTGSNNTSQTISFSQEAEQLGVDGLLIVNPYYNKPNQEGLYQHFRAVAESVRIPVILYNVPGRAGVNLLPETTARLAEINNIVAVKDATGNVDQAADIVDQCPKDFLVYSGDDALTLPMLAVGGYGVISVAAHVAGKKMAKMIENYLEGNVKQAAEAHGRLNKIFKAMFIDTNPVPVKAALNLLGHDVGGLRLPLTNIPQSKLEIIREVLKDGGIL